jgi:hypothetical protein
MKTLTLNLDDSLAARFNNLSSAEKSRIEKIMGIVLEEIFKKDQINAFIDVLNKTAGQAEKNGLTIAKLAELMEWDETTTRNIFGNEAVRNGC